MTKKISDELFSRVLDAVLMYGSLRKACKAAGITEVTLWRWRRASEDGEVQYQEVDYRGLTQPLHIHIEDCIEQSVDEIESNLRATARDGYWRPIIWHGEYCYEPDEMAATMGEQELKDCVELGIIYPDKLKRVVNPETGQMERVKMMEWIAPSVEAQTVVLRAWSDRYADKRSMKFEGSLALNQNLGVTILGERRDPPKQLEVVTLQIMDAVNEAVTDAVFDETEPEPMPKINNAEPFEPDPNSPLSPEQQAILARARSGNRLAADLAARALKRKAAPPTARPVAPPAPVYLGDLDQPDDVPRAPRGTKVV